MTAPRPAFETRVVAITDCRNESLNRVRCEVLALDLHPGDLLTLSVRRSDGKPIPDYWLEERSAGDPGEMEARADRLFGGEAARRREEGRG